MRCATCEEEAIEGSYYCQKHGGFVEIQKKNRAAIYNFNKTKYMKELAARSKEMKASPEFTSVKEELGILRVVLERLLDRIESDDELLLRQGEIMGLIDKIEKLTKTVREAEKELGVLLSRDQMKEVVGLLVKTIEDCTSKLDNKFQATKLSIRGFTKDDVYKQIDALFSDTFLLEFKENVADRFGEAIDGLYSKSQA